MLLISVILNANYFDELEKAKRRWLEDNQTNRQVGYRRKCCRSGSDDDWDSYSTNCQKRRRTFIEYGKRIRKFGNWSKFSHQ